MKNLTFSIRGKYRIYVTKNDIKNGKRGNCSKCPVALALYRRFPDFKIKVGALIKIGHELLEIKNRVAFFIHDFDGGKKVKPFSFYIVI